MIIIVISISVVGVIFLVFWSIYMQVLMVM